MMNRLMLTAWLCLAPLVAVAESATVGRTLHEVILPGFAELALSTQAMADTAQSDCRADNPKLRSDFNTAFDAWLAVETYRAGPLEEAGNGLAIAFWPDTKGARPRALNALLAAPTIPQGEAFSETSVAARGLFAMETMLYDSVFNGYDAGDPGCQLVQAIATDLAQTANRVNRSWIDDFGPLMLSAGEQGNTRFLSPDEVIQQLYTASLTELEFIAEVRIGRPLGDSRPRPNRAEARASGRSLRNVTLSVEAAAKLARSLAGVNESDMTSALDYVDFAAKQIRDPAFADLETPSANFRLQELQSSVLRARAAVMADLSVRLGVGEGFNALDGD
jgi:uncharacterized protein